MCLFIKGTPEILTAKTDIVVYKVFRGKDRESPYIGFKYKSNTLYRLRKALLIEKYMFGKGFVVNAGFHSFVSKTDAQNFCSNLMVHSISSMSECIIPKGAKYIKGRFSGTEMNEYVSTSLRTGNLK